MERLCFVVELYPGTEEEYERRHDEIWPELVEAIRASGFRNYTLFRRGTQVVGYVECHPDVATAFSTIQPNGINKRWAKWFEDVIVELADENGDLIKMDEVWHLD
jgi:L-rhamnose mutarotase